MHGIIYFPVIYFLIDAWCEIYFPALYFIVDVIDCLYGDTCVVVHSISFKCCHWNYNHLLERKKNESRKCSLHIQYMVTHE
jgi:hypothetical protein